MRCYLEDYCARVGPWAERSRGVARIGVVTLTECLLTACV